MEGQFDPAYQPAAPERPRRGCLFYGCLGAAILGLLLVLLLGLGAYQGYKLVDDFVREYGDDAPEPVPIVEAPAAEVEAVQDRVKRFRDDLLAGRATAPLTLTAAEINAQIASYSALKGRLAVEFKDDKIRGEVSVPLDKLGFPANYLFPGKHLNGQAELRARIVGDELMIQIDDFRVRGKPIPANILALVRAENLGREANTGANAAVTTKIESLAIKDGVLVITPRPPPAPAPAAVPAPDKAAEPKADPDP